MHFRWIAGVSLVTLSLAVALRPQSTGADPFAILKPDIAINQDDRQKLDERDVVRRYCRPRITRSPCSQRVLSMRRAPS